MGLPRHLSVYFSLVKQALQFYQQNNVKMFIQYTVMGFEPTTFRY